jgi:2Fe-2S ferredoxin
MPKIMFIEYNGTEHVVEAVVGRTLMQAAVDNVVPGIVADCGGSCSCATCHGFIDREWLVAIPAPQADENSLLEGLLDIQHNSRLTCQIEITLALDGLTVRLPKSQF